MDKTSELLAAAFVKDCSGGDRLMKLNTMEGRLLSRLTTLINQYLHYNLVIPQDKEHIIVIQDS